MNLNKMSYCLDLLKLKLPFHKMIVYSPFYKIRTKDIDMSVNEVCFASVLAMICRSQWPRDLRR